MDATRLQAYLTDIPGWNKAVVADVELIGAGWESKIYAFTATLPDVTLHLALRMYTGSDGPYKAQVESGGMPRLRTMGYPVPQVFLYELDAATLGLPFIDMDRIFGSQLWDEMRRQPDQRAAYEKGFIDLLVELHRLDWKPFLGDQPIPQNSHDLIRRDLALWRDMVTAIPVTGFGDGLHWFESRLAAVTPSSPAVVHNDFHPANVLVTQDTSAFVIDWTSLGVGDPRSDLAWTLMLVEFEDGPEARQRIQRRYEAELATTDLDYFMAGAYVKRLYSLVASLTHGPETLGMRAGAANEMRNHLERADGIYNEFRRITGERLTGFEELTSR